MVETRGRTQEKVTLAVRPRGKPIQKLPEEITVTATGATRDIYNQLSSHASIDVNRLRVTKGSDNQLVQNSKDVLIDSTGLRHQSTIYVKDLGLQIAWRTVFVIEYLGPLLIHPILYLTLTDSRPSFLQTLTLALVLIHFGKRELEILLVHRFSAASMPVFNLFKNSGHYWFLSGLNMAYWVYYPGANIAQGSNPYITSTGLVLFIVGEVGNLIDHLILRNLRSAGGTERGIPEGLGFDLVTCPNYMFESVAWLGIIMISWSLSTVLFVVVALIQMAIWAQKKEAKYRREFGAKYRRKRYTVIPGVI